MTPFSADLRRILLEALVIVLVGAMLGLTFNYRLVMDLFLAPPAPKSPPAATPEAGYPLPASLAEVRELMQEGSLPVDARAAELFAEGHLPGARSLPLGESESGIELFLREVPPDRVLIVYCSGYGCPDSFDLAQKLLAAGYRQVRLFDGGFPEWRDGGLPVETGP